MLFSQPGREATKMTSPTGKVVVDFAVVGMATVFLTAVIDAKIASWNSQMPAVRTQS